MSMVRISIFLFQFRGFHVSWVCQKNSTSTFSRFCPHPLPIVHRILDSTSHWGYPPRRVIISESGVRERTAAVLNAGIEVQYFSVRRDSSLFFVKFIYYIYEVLQDTGATTGQPLYCVTDLTSEKQQITFIPRY
jgi:hypothetical protein